MKTFHGNTYDPKYLYDIEEINIYGSKKPDSYGTTPFLGEYMVTVIAGAACGHESCGVDFYSYWFIDLDTASEFAFSIKPDDVEIILHLDVDESQDL